MIRLGAQATLIGALCLCGAIAAQAKEPERTFVEVHVSHEQVYVGQRFRVTLSFGYDVEYFRDHAAPLFRQETDVPAQLKAPWLEGLRGTRSLVTSIVPTTRTPLRLPVNAGVIPIVQVSDVDRDGTAFCVLRLPRDFVAERPGDLVLAAPTIRYVHADRFEEDFVGGRVPIDPRDVIAEGEARTLEVRALPAEGRPSSFSGAVGTFTAYVAYPYPRTVTVGRSFNFRLSVVGTGHVPALRPPSMDGFHVISSSEVLDDGEPRVICELVATRPDVTEIPAVSFCFFDPAPPGSFRTLSSVPFPLRVLPAPGGAPPPPGQEDDGDPPPAGALWLRLLIVIGSAVIGVGLVWLTGINHRARKRAESQIDPEIARAEQAAAALRAQAAKPGPGLTDAFAEFLSVHLRCSRAAVIGPDLRAKLAAAGVDASLAHRAATAMESLVAAQYGSGEDANGGVDAALIDDLEQALRNEDS